MLEMRSTEELKVEKCAESFEREGRGPQESCQQRADDADVLTNRMNIIHKSVAREHGNLSI